MGDKQGEPVFFRHEHKFLISSAQSVVLRSKLDAVLRRDIHCPNGSYLISSLYFDDYDDSCFEANEAGLDERKKYRIRIYNRSCDYISLECKEKIHEMTRKSSCRLSFDEADSLVKGFPAGNFSEHEPLFRSLVALNRIRGMKPKIVVEYRRIPYVYSFGNVRITFDYDLACSSDVDEFLHGEGRFRPVMPKGLQLLEVKFDDYMPETVSDLLQLDELRHSPFSKYYVCRHFGMMKE